MKFDIYKSESKRPKTYIVTFEPDGNHSIKTRLELRAYSKKFFRASEQDLVIQRGYILKNELYLEPVEGAKKCVVAHYHKRRS